MLPLTAQSRRALVASATALVATPVATAKKKKGKKKKKPTPPLAFAVVTVVKLVFSGSPTFACTVGGAWRYPAESAVAVLDTVVDVALGVDSQVRAQIVAALQEFVSGDIAEHGHDVPANRIAVILL